MPRKKTWRIAAARRRETKPLKTGGDAISSEEHCLIKNGVEDSNPSEAYHLVNTGTKKGAIPEEYHLVKPGTKALPKTLPKTLQNESPCESDHFFQKHNVTQTDLHSEYHCDLENLTQREFQINPNSTVIDENNFLENVSPTTSKQISALVSEEVDTANVSRNTVFGSFNQASLRYSEQSAGRQCMCNALISLCFLLRNPNCNQNDVNHILDEGDYLYRETMAVLMSTNALRDTILQIEELPNTVELASIGNFTIVRGSFFTGTIDRDRNDEIFMSLNSAMEAIFAESCAAILVLDGYAMSVMRQGDHFAFFDSHSHGIDGLSGGADGTAIFRTFETLEHLVLFIRQFAFSLNLHGGSSFDIQAMKIQYTSGRTVPRLESPPNLMEAYFDFQETQKREQRKLYMRNYMKRKRDDITFRKAEKKNEALSKEKARQSHNYRDLERQKETLTKQKARLDEVLKNKLRTNEKTSKQKARQDDEFRKQERQKENLTKQKARQDDEFRKQERQKETLTKQKARLDEVLKNKLRTNEKTSKQKARQDDEFRKQERQKENLTKQKARQDDEFRKQERQKENLTKQKARLDEVLKNKLRTNEKTSKQKARQDDEFRKQERQKENLTKQKARQDDEFRKQERQKENLTKQKARQDDEFRKQEREKETLSKQKARQDETFRQSERSKDVARKMLKRTNKYFQEHERLSRQQKRRDFHNKQRENVKCKQVKATKRKSNDFFQKENEQRKRRKYGQSLDACIEQFHKTMSSGPDYVCISCNQTYFKESVVHAERQKLSEIMRENLSNVLSVDNKKWLCNTCMTYLKKDKIPPMSTANGMKFPDKPPELQLHQLEERLIALRIPFMQMRELPRGGQTSIRGNVVNVPTDVSNTVNTLPSNLSESQTVPVQLKRKLSYNRTACVENVRPQKVMKGLQWLMKNSELYKDSNIQFDQSWQTSLTQADEQVNAFLEEPSESESNNQTEELAQDDSDRFSEIDESETQVGNSDTMLDDQTDYNTVRSVAPGEGQHPLSIFQDQHSESLSFPTIYCGQKQVENSERTAPVSYSDVAKWELRSADRRVARNVPNLFFKVKKLQMKQVRDKTTLALRRFKMKGKKVTAKDMLNNENVKQVVNLDEGFYIFRTLRNSPPYLEKRKKDVFAMIRQLGLPTWFTSFSAADTKWLDLLRSLGKLVDQKDYSDEEIIGMSWKDKTKLLNSDPVTCARYFDHRVNLFINNVLKSTHNPIGKVIDYFYRVEFQQRGSPHIHMLVWIDNAPKYQENGESEIAAFVDQYIQCVHSNDEDELASLIKLQTHKHSKTCRKGGKAVCRFGFPLPPMRETMILEPLDECSNEEQKQYAEKYEDLHRKLNLLKDPTDRSETYEEFLENMAEMTHDDYIKVIRSSLRSPKVYLKRSLSQIRVNAYNRQILKAWKANLDIQYILDPYACAMYIVSYLNKSQRGMSLLMEQAVREARDGNFELKRQVRHIGNKFLNSVEISAQEAAYLVLQLPLTRSSRDVLFINTSKPEDRTVLMKSKDQLEKLDPESTDIESNNLIRRYSSRPKQLECWCLADYASKLNFKYPKCGESRPDSNEEPEILDNEFENVDSEIDEQEEVHTAVSIELKNGTKITSRKTPKVIRYVKFNKNVDSENYYRERLMLFMPWRNEEKDLLGEYNNYEDNFNSMHGKLAEKMREYERHADVLEQAQRLANDDMNLDEVAPNTGHREAVDAEAGSRPSQDYVFFNPDDNPEHTNYDIGQDIGFPATSTQNQERFPNIINDEDYRKLMMSLNKKQKDLVTHVLQSLRTKSEPMHIFLSGGAGVGKSVVIRALYQMLFRELNLRAGENPEHVRILLCAPTGKAAYIIKGNTIHSAFKIPACQKLQCKPLPSDQLNTLRTKYMNLSVLIIDEVSMCGNRMLRLIDQRLRQIKGVNKVFGGIHVILVGDLHQLRPVLDGWIFQDLDHDYGPLATNLWKENFLLYELSEIMRQKDDKQFAELLNRLREGKELLCENPSDEQKAEYDMYVKDFNEQRQNDIDVLKTCCVKPDDADYKTNDIHLFPTNALVNNHNDKAFTQCTGEKGHVVALDDVVGDFSSDVKQTMRERVAQGDASKTGGLMDKLPLACGMKYELCSNLSVEDGLTNGAPCSLMLIERKMTDKTDRPSILWVKFDDVNGKQRQQQYKHFYHANIDKSWVPIFDKTVSFPLRMKTRTASALRTQFPLRPSAAKTIHRSQGDTMKSVVVHMGTSKRAISHMHYVALSRVQNMAGLQILELNETAISTSTDVKIEMKLLREERSLPLCFEKLYDLSGLFTVGYQNARSFHLHNKEVSNDSNLMSLDILGIAESRLCANDLDTAFCLPGYDMYRNDSQSHSSCRSHHGLVTFVKQPHVVQRIHHYSSNTLEFTALSVLSPVPLQVVSLYRPPSGSKTQFLAELETELLKVVNPQSSLAVLGDFNFDLMSENENTMLKRLMMNVLCCHQLIDNPTTIHGSLLDHIWVNCEVKSSGTIASTWSDHSCIYMTK